MPPCPQRQSPEAVSFLESRGLDLSSVTQLGGHSVPRSFSPPSGPNVGLAIMQALIKQAQELPDLIIRGGTKVTEVRPHHTCTCPVHYLTII